MRRLSNIIIVVLVLAIGGAGATYWRYQSFDPCIWMEQDLVAYFDLPLAVVQTKIRADFLLDGILEPGPKDCLFEWWRLRREGSLSLS